jgi:protein-arginine kinase activator protein McsA
MDLKNFTDKIFIGSVNIMKTDEWKWPDKWEHDRKIKFLTDLLNYAKENEFWEQAAVIRDVTTEIEKETRSVSGNTEE